MTLPPCARPQSLFPLVYYTEGTLDQARSLPRLCVERSSVVLILNDVALVRVCFVGDAITAPPPTDPLRRRRGTL